MQIPGWYSYHQYLVPISSDTDTNPGLEFTEGTYFVLLLWDEHLKRLIHRRYNYIKLCSPQNQYVMALLCGSRLQFFPRQKNGTHVHFLFDSLFDGWLTHICLCCKQRMLYMSSNHPFNRHPCQCSLEKKQNEAVHLTCMTLLYHLGESQHGCIFLQCVILTHRCVCIMLQKRRKKEEEEKKRVLLWPVWGHLSSLR